MRVFRWMLCPGIISHGETQHSLSLSLSLCLSLCLSFSLSLSLSLSHAHTSTHIVADMLTFPDRRLSLSLCGCKVFSPQTALLRNNKHARAHTHVLRIAPSRCHKSSRGASQQGRISLGENCGQGEKNQHCPQNMPPLHHCSSNTGLQSLYDRTDFPVFSITCENAAWCYWTAFRKEKKNVKHSCGFSIKLSEIWMLWIHGDQYDSF